eukprot:1401125-Rhodomonas_salina.2
MHDAPFLSFSALLGEADPSLPPLPLLRAPLLVLLSLLSSSAPSPLLEVADSTTLAPPYPPLSPWNSLSLLLLLALLGATSLSSLLSSAHSSLTPALLSSAFPLPSLSSEQHLSLFSSLPRSPQHTLPSHARSTLLCVSFPLALLWATSLSLLPDLPRASLALPPAPLGAAPPLPSLSSEQPRSRSLFLTFLCALLPHTRAHLLDFSSPSLSSEQPLSLSSLLSSAHSSLSVGLEERLTAAAWKHVTGDSCEAVLRDEV